MRIGGSPGPAWRRLGCNRPSTHSLGGGNNLLNGMAARVGKIERTAFAVGKQIIKGADMGLGDVHHMDVIAYAGPIVGIVISAVDVDRGAITRRCQHQWDEVCLRIMLLADFAIRIRTPLH